MMPGRVPHVAAATSPLHKTELCRTKHTTREEDQLGNLRSVAGNVL